MSASQRRDEATSDRTRHSPRYTREKATAHGVCAGQDGCASEWTLQGRLDLDQALFRNDVTIRYLNGESKRDAVDNATAMARIWNPLFHPELSPGFWDA